jgi:colanic acid/amylovoran biosynthesis glycosyltransferase
VRIAYFVNQYPAVSHSFIRREIYALEARGYEILRVALRGWDNAVVDAEDEDERARTRYVLRRGVPPLLWAVLRTVLTRPARFAAALRLAVRTGWHAERPFAYHLGYLAEACRMLPWLRDYGAEHVHAHFGTNSAAVVMLARELGGPPYSFTVHGPDEFDTPRLLGIAEKVGRSAFVVAISSFCRSQLYRWVARAYWPKVRVIHCGLDPSFLDYPATPAPAAPRLVCVGRLSEQKGHLLLIEAASRLAARGVSFELVVVGGGGMRAELETLIEALALRDRVRLTGPVSSERLREEIIAARALVLPSFAEGLPGVIMEAMALRRPVITTYVAGIPELVRAGENGWLVPAGSIDSLTAAMEDCLKQPIEALRAMGEAAHARVRERHSVAIQAQKLGALLRHGVVRATERADSSR